MHFRIVQVCDYKRTRECCLTVHVLIYGSHGLSPSVMERALHCPYLHPHSVQQQVLPFVSSSRARVECERQNSWRRSARARVSVCAARRSYFRVAPAGRSLAHSLSFQLLAPSPNNNKWIFRSGGGTGRSGLYAQKPTPESLPSPQAVAVVRITLLISFHHRKPQDNTARAPRVTECERTKRTTTTTHRQTAYVSQSVSQ